MSHGRPDYFPNLPPQMALPGFGGIWLILPPPPLLWIFGEHAAFVPLVISGDSDGGFQGNVRDRRRDAATVTQNSLATLFTLQGPLWHSFLPSFRSIYSPFPLLLCCTLGVNVVAVEAFCGTLF